MKTVSRLLRVGLAFSFLYAGIAGLLEPQQWVGYIPSFARSFVSAYTALFVFGVVEIILGVWLLSGKQIRKAAALSALLFVAITLSNTGVFAVTFRDVSLFFMSMALWALHKRT